jgi:hypothetical protein
MKLLDAIHVYIFDTTAEQNHCRKPPMKMTRCSSCPCRNGPEFPLLCVCERERDEEGHHVLVPCTLDVLMIGAVLVAGFGGSQSSGRARR